MFPNAVIQISPKDRDLIEDNQLGTPLIMHFVKNEIIRRSAIAGYFLSALSTVVLIIFVIIDNINQQNILLPSNIKIWASYISIIFVLLFGLFLLLIDRPSLKRKRIIVCSYGLLQVRTKILGSWIDIVYWEEIQKIESYSWNKDRARLVRRSGKPIVPVDYYENFDGLLAQIKQYSHLA